jgi:hypothetical protein
MINPFYYQATSVDTVAVFVADSLQFPLPIVLSTAVGRSEFIRFDQIPNTVQKMPSMNRQVEWSTNTHAVIGGTITLSPQSLALSAIREIVTYQTGTGDIIKGTVSITNAGSQIQTVIRNFSFVNPPYGMAWMKSISDVTLRFSCGVPNQVNLGGVISPIIGQL